MVSWQMQTFLNFNFFSTLSMRERSGALLVPNSGIVSLDEFDLCRIFKGCKSVGGYATTRGNRARRAEITSVNLVLLTLADLYICKHHCLSHTYCIFYYRPFPRVPICCAKNVSSNGPFDIVIVAWHGPIGVERYSCVC